MKGDFPLALRLGGQAMGLDPIPPIDKHNSLPDDLVAQSYDDFPNIYAQITPDTTDEQLRMWLKGQQEEKVTEPTKREYNTGQIRKLLTEAFNHKDLPQILRDSPTSRFTELGKRCRGMGDLYDMVDVVIDYCEQFVLFDQLLDEVKNHNPAKYNQFKDKIYRN